jgi:DNA-binding CsgD family transcriptional regulator
MKTTNTELRMGLNATANKTNVERIILATVGTKKTAREISDLTGIPISTVKATLNYLQRRGLAFVGGMTKVNRRTCYLWEINSKRVGVQTRECIIVRADKPDI